MTNAAPQNQQQQQPSRTTVATNSVVEIPSINNLDSQNDGRQNPAENRQDITFKKFFNNLIGDFHLNLFLMLSVCLILLVVTQALKGEFGVALIIFEILMGIHLLILVRQHCLCRTIEEKKENAYNIIEAVIYLAWLLTMSSSISNNQVGTPFIVVTALLLIHHCSKTLNLYYEGKSVDWKFARYLNIIMTISRVIFMAQLILIVLKANHNVTCSWLLTFIPLYIFGFQYICHICFLASIPLSSIGRIVFRPLGVQKVIGLTWLFIIPLISAAAAVLSGLRVAQVLDSKGGYDAEKRPFLALFCGAVGAILFAMIYSYCFEKEIYTIVKYFTGVFGLDPSDRERIMSLAEKLREEQRKNEEDKYVPKYLIRISNAYFKIPTKAEASLAQKQKPNEVKPASQNDISLIVQEDSKKVEVEEKPAESLADLEKNDNTKCVICFDAQPDAAYLPCGHGGACFTCAKEIVKTKGECHLCRCQIRRLAKLDIQENPTLTTEHVKIISILKAH